MLHEDDEHSSSCSSEADGGELVYGGTITPQSHEGGFDSNIYEAMDQHCASICQGPTTCLDTSATLRYPNGHYPTQQHHVANIHQQQQHLAPLHQHLHQAAMINPHHQQFHHNTLGGAGGGIVDDSVLHHLQQQYHLQQQQQQQHFATLGAASGGIAQQQQLQTAHMNTNHFYPTAEGQQQQFNTIYHNPYQQQLIYNQQQLQNGGEMNLSNHHKGTCPLAAANTTNNNDNNNTSRHRPSPTSLATTTTTPTGSGGANHHSSSSNSSNSGQPLPLDNHNLMLLHQQPIGATYLHQSQYSGYNPLDYKQPTVSNDNGTTFYNGRDDNTAATRRSRRNPQRPRSSNSVSSTWYYSPVGCWARARATNCYWRASKIFSWKRAFVLLALSVFSASVILLLLRAVFPAAQQSDLRLSGDLARNNNKSFIVGENGGSLSMVPHDEDVYSEYPFLVNNGKNRYASSDSKPYPRFDTAQDIVNSVAKHFVINPYDWALLRLNNQPRLVGNSGGVAKQSILFNITLMDDESDSASKSNQARIAFYGRREKLPTHTMYNFVKIITNDGSEHEKHVLIKRSAPARININNLDDHPFAMRSRIMQTKQSVLIARQSFIETLQEGVWYFALFNDATYKQYVDVRLDEVDAGNVISEQCPDKCSGHGICRAGGNCDCFDGYSGIDCSASTPASNTGQQCPVLCSNNGRYERGRCVCNFGWAGRECDQLSTSVPSADDEENQHQQQTYDWKPSTERRQCPAQCEQHGQCLPGGQCVCQPGWFGVACTLRNEDDEQHETRHHHRFRPHTSNSSSSSDGCNKICTQNGKCIGDFGLCLCNKGWNGRLCTFEGCPNNCSTHGECRLGDAPQPVSTAVTNSPAQQTTDDSPLALQQVAGIRQQQQQKHWYCECQAGFTGAGCERPREVCHDGIDNDGDGLVDCHDNDCCSEQHCRNEIRCIAPPEPQQLLLREAPLPETASFWEMVKFLIGAGRVQLYVNDMSIFDETRVSVIRGRVVDADGVGLVAVRVAVFVGGREQPAYGITLTRQQGWFDFVVNGGGAVTLGFIKDGYVKSFSTLMTAGWNEFVLAEHEIVLQRDLLHSDESVEVGRRTTRNATTNADLCTSSAALSLLYSKLSFQPELVSVPDAPKYQPSTKSATLNDRIFIESQILQQIIRLPGASDDISLVHHSHKVEGRETILLIRLLPKSTITRTALPDELVKIVLQLNVAGVSTTVELEPAAGLSYLFAWNGLNAYGQKVYGQTRASVLVSYYFAVDDEVCDKNTVVVERRVSTELAGYELTLADIGGWNLPIHHRLDIRTGVLYRGDGTKVQLITDQNGATRIGGSSGEGDNSVGNLLPWLGTIASAENNGGVSRAPPTSSSVHDTRLLNPLSMATSADGSVFIADYNFVRQVIPRAAGGSSSSSQQVFTVLELPVEDAVEGYYIAVSPIDGSVYVSLPRRRQIIKLKTLASTTAAQQQINAKKNFIVVAGTGEQCLPQIAPANGQNQMLTCGDTFAAEQAKLIYPKSLAIDQFGNLFFADGTAIRMISEAGIMSTVIAARFNDEKWQPSNWGCANSDKSSSNVAQVSLSWPNALAINPLDSQLYFADETKIFKLATSRKTIELVAGHDITCTMPPGEAKSDNFELTWPKSITFSTAGNMFVLESNYTSLSNNADNIKRQLLSWRVVQMAASGAGKVILESSCLCATSNNHDICPCIDNNQASSTLTNVRSLAITPDDRLLVGSSGSTFESARIYQLAFAQAVHSSINNYFIRSMANRNNMVAVNDGVHSEKYIFNQYGQHLETRQISSSAADQQSPHQVKYRFSYTSGTQFRKLESVKDHTGANLFTVKRNYRDQVEELRVPGHVFAVQSARRSTLLKKLIETIASTKATRGKSKLIAANIDDGTFTVAFDYDELTGLVRSRTDHTGRSFKFDYDNNGRLTRVVYPTGQQTALIFNAEEPSVIVSGDAAANGDSSGAVSVRILPQRNNIEISAANDLDEPLYISSPGSGISEQNKRSLSELSSSSLSRSTVNVAKPNHFSLTFQDQTNSGTAIQALNFISNDVKVLWAWHSRQPVTSYINKQLSATGAASTLTSSPTNARDLLIHQLRLQDTVALSVAEFGRSNKQCILTADLSTKLLCATKAADVVGDDYFGWSSLEPSSDAQLHTATVQRNSRGFVSELRFGERIKRFTYNDGRLSSVSAASTKSSGRTQNDVRFYYSTPVGQLARISNGKLSSASIVDLVRNSANEVKTVFISPATADEIQSAPMMNSGNISHHFRQTSLIGKRRYVHAVGDSGTIIQDYDAQNRLVSHAFTGTKRLFLKYSDDWSKSPQQVSDSMSASQASFYTTTFKLSQQQSNVVGFNHQNARDFFERHLEKRSDYAGLVLWSTTNFDGQFGRANCLPVNVTTTLRNRSPWQQIRSVKIGSSDSVYFESELELSYDFNTNTKRIGPFIITRSVRSSSNQDSASGGGGGVYTTINGHRAVFVYKTNKYGQLASRVLNIGDQQVAALKLEHSDEHGGKVESVKLLDGDGESNKNEWTISYDDRNRTVQTQKQSGQEISATSVAYDFAENLIAVQTTGSAIAPTNLSFIHDENAYQIKSINQNAAVTYDADGFVTNIGDVSFNWNTAGQLSSARTKRPSAKSIRYDYDHRGRLVARSESESGELVQFFYTDSENWQRVTHYYEKHRRRMTSLSYDDMGQVIALDVSTLGTAADRRNTPVTVTYLVLQDRACPRTLFFNKLTGQKATWMERSVLLGQLLTAANIDLLYFPFNSRMEIVDDTVGITFVHSEEKEKSSVLGDRIRYYSSMLGRFIDVAVRDLRDINLNRLNPYAIKFEVGEIVEMEQVFDYTHWLRIFGFDKNQLLPSDLLKLHYSSPQFDSATSLGSPSVDALDAVQARIASFFDSYFPVSTAMLHRGSSYALPLLTPASSSVKYSDNVILRIEPFGSDNARARLIAESLTGDSAAASAAAVTTNKKHLLFDGLFNGSFVIPFTVSTRRVQKSLESSGSLVKQDNSFLPVEHVNIVVDLNNIGRGGQATLQPLLTPNDALARLKDFVAQARQIFGEKSVTLSDEAGTSTTNGLLLDRRIAIRDPSSTLQFNIDVFASDSIGQRETALAQHWAMAVEQLNVLARENPTAVTESLLR